MELRGRDNLDVAEPNSCLYYLGVICGKPHGVLKLEQQYDL
jgi:hypothetical protein